MSETSYNPNDSAFLASRSLDEQLSTSERQRLDDAMAASESLRAEAEEIRAIDRLVKRWGIGEVELDWATHGKLIEAKALSRPDDDRDCKLDELLERWAGVSARIDDEEFTAAVMARVPSRRHRVWRRSLVFRLSVPLAAAAAVALVVTGTLLDWSSPSPRVEISIRQRHAAVESPSEPTRVAMVSFRREPAVGFAPEPTSPGISFMVVGASPLPEDWPDEVPPL